MTDAPFIPAPNLPINLTSLLGEWRLPLTGWLLRVEMLDWFQAGLWLETSPGYGQSLWAKVSYHPLLLEFEWHGNRIQLSLQGSQWLWTDEQPQVLEALPFRADGWAELKQPAYPWLGHWLGCWEGAPKVHLVLSMQGVQPWLHYLCPGDIRYGVGPTYWRWPITDSWSWLLPDSSSLHLALHQDSIELIQQGQRPFYSAELVRQPNLDLTCPWIEQLSQMLEPLTGHELQTAAAQAFQQQVLQGLPLLLPGAAEGQQRLLFLAEAMIHAELLADFNRWTPGMHPMHSLAGTRLRWLVLDLPESARFDYQLLTDVGVGLDPWNRSPVNRTGRINRSSGCLPGHREFQRLNRRLAGELRSATMAGRAVELYLPPVAGPWKLLLVQDGAEALFDLQLAAVLDQLIAQQLIPPIMAVCIPTTNRMAEYALNHGYQDWLLTSLLSELESCFPISPESEDWALLGISMGAIQSLFMALSGSFGRVAVMTPAGPIAVREPLLHLLRQQALPVNTLCMNLALFDYPPWLLFGQTLAHLWQQQQVKAVVQIDADGHNYGYYAASLPALLQRLWA